MIYPIIFYTAKCDHCNLEWRDESPDWAAMIEESQMDETLDDEDWHTTEDGKHYCYDCWSWDDDDEIELDPERKDKFPNKAHPSLEELAAEILQSVNNSTSLLVNGWHEMTAKEANENSTDIKNDILEIVKNGLSK